MLKLLKQRTPSTSNLNPNLSKKDDDESSSIPMSPPSSILKKPSGDITPQLINYSSMVIATFTNSLIPFAIYKSSITPNTNTSSSIIINLGYQCSSAIVMSEILKLIIAIFIVFYEFEYDIPRTMETMLFDVFQVHTFAITGILYAISAVITIKMISEIGFLYIYYSLIFQIFFTMFIWKIIFHQKKIPNKQWISIGLIAISTLFLTFEYADSWSYFPFMSDSVFSSNTDLNEILNDDGISNNNHNLNAVIDVNDFELHEHGRNLLDNNNISMFRNYWWIFLFIESLFGSIGSVIAEQKYKTFEKNLSYFAQSSSMYLWSLVIASVLFYIANIKQASKELLLLNLTYALEGFNIYTWFLVIMYLLYGYSMNYVIKYNNNMVRLLILSISICFSHILIYWIQTNQGQFIVQIGLLCVVSYVCVASSVWLYWKKI